MKPLAPAILRALDELKQQSQLVPMGWLLQLQTRDEPPLFERSEQVEFLRALPREQRGPAVLGLGLDLLLQAEHSLKHAVLAAQQQYFVALTLSDWDLFEQDRQAVPTLALQVNAHEERDSAQASLLRPSSAFARLAQTWLDGLTHHQPHRFCVAEYPDATHPLHRVYVGLREPMTTCLQSVGQHLQGSPRGNGPCATRMR